MTSYSDGEKKGSATAVDDVSTAQRIVQEVDGIFDEWWLIREEFEPRENAPIKREDRLHLSFHGKLQDRLRARNGAQFIVRKQAYPFAGLGRPELSNSFCKYDVAVDHSSLSALLELSIDDSTVCHALHNGEQKLLGICDGVGCAKCRGRGPCETCKPFWLTRGLTTKDVEYAREELSAIPVRGIFFISRLPHQSLDRLQPTVWTDGGGRPFRSAMISSPMTSLGEVFERLNQFGLFIWYYSLVDDTPPLKLRPPGFVINKEGGTPQWT